MALPIVPTDADSKQLRDALTTAADDFRLLRSKPELSDDERSEVRSLASFIGEVDTVERAMARLETPEVPEAKGPQAALDTPVTRSRSFGEQVTADEGYIEFARTSRASSGFEEIEVRGSMFQRALVTEGVTADGGFLLPLAQPIMEPPRTRRLFIRDLLSVTQTGMSMVPYIQEVTPGTFEIGATAVAEGTLKPEVEMHWSRQDAPIRKIAAWIPVTTEVIDDAPTLRGYIDQRLLYMIALREELQVLNGPGTGPNIKGIRQQTGLQTQAQVANDLPAGIALSIAKIENVDGEADGVAINPLDYWTAVSTRHATQLDNGFGGNAPATASGITWGLPALRTRGMEVGKYLVGSFRLGATLLDREQATIRVGNQHADYFTNNKVVVLGEERVGLAVHRPDFFVEGSV